MSDKQKDFVVNVLIIAATLAIVWNIWSYFRPATGNGNVPAKGSEFKVAEFDPAGSQINVLIFLRTGCAFCENSMPFYRRIAELSNTANVKVITFFEHSDLEASEYLKRFQLMNVGISWTNFDSLGIKGTPTIILLDGSGKVAKSWVGQLDDASEREIENLLKSALTD